MRSMRELGHDCVLVAASEQEGLHREVRDGITVYTAKLKNLYLPKHNKRQPVSKKLLWHAIDSFNPFMQGALKRVVEAEKPDVASVHCLNGWSALAMRTLSRASIPIVQVLHGYEYICVKSTMFSRGSNCVSQCLSCRIFRLPHPRLSRCADAVVGVSRFTLERHLDSGYFRGVAIQRVIHNARDPWKLGVNGALAPRLQTKPLRIGYIGRIDPSKGIDMLLHAFDEAALGDVELWIAGSGQSGYESSLRSRWASERIRFLGRTAPRDFYPNVDITVVPSLWEEPLGMVVAEGMAFGKPVIGARRGGISEMIVDGESGFLFDPESPVELIGAMRRLVNDAGMRARMGARALTSAIPYMDPEGWASKYATVYAEVARKHGPPVSPRDGEIL
ncbi:Glycosyltransferase involved in cell wall bisynthesis [Dyella jiangningensis]|nr:glycosyltransferase involved in cell wall biosynthesis [Dyella sp. AtDHG13]SDJ27649.1 Glycosyltransferase involved in cell wall bisynthesis [Dyella jiangningensis]